MKSVRPPKAWERLSLGSQSVTLCVCGAVCWAVMGPFSVAVAGPCTLELRRMLVYWPCVCASWGRQDAQ